MIKPQQLKAQNTQVLQTITYAIYAYNSKTAEQTQRLKYGDLEIVLKNEHFEFVCKGGAVISNIKEILFMNSKIKGITDDITSIPPEEQRYYALNAFPKVLKIGRFNLNEEFIEGFLNDIMKKVDKEYVNSELNKKADKEYVDEKDNEIKEMVEWYHEWTSKILKTKADTGWVSGCLDLKADKTYVNDELNKKADKEYVDSELNKKADKNHTHTFFSTVAIESIEGTVEGTDGDALYCKPPNFPQGLTSDENITTMKYIRCRNVYVMDDENNVKFTAQDLYDKKADKTELQTLKTEILQTLYPVGSIYTSMNSTNPSEVLGFGTWKQIVDKFLYCARYSKQTGGSKKIKEANLPPHTHTGTTNTTGNHSHSITKRGYINLAAGSDRWGMNRYDITTDPVDSSTGIFCGTAGNHSHTFTTNPTGSGKDYMPPFVTVFAWYRIH
ncbi:phage tail repeat-like family [Trichomonas vaginalis G3]|uniref:phage tail repeat-like family n=1 Tax=Trichomonas vaginalis (strain ATCC PRA-98 / G3) TaxID=412133 RepID=UPI0021E5D6FA|nr:phage tail repeat-like family [Trichomonas vaginalis G3]KAI5531105.1 phage tail repeat-like family [Trichomonas vaginalis G3]